MKKRIKLMAEYECYPLWWIGTDDLNNIDPASLPLSTETILRLEKWANIYDTTLNDDDPISSKFADVNEEEAFDQEGIYLWQQLQQELSPNYEILYYSNKIGKLLTYFESVVVNK